MKILIGYAMRSGSTLLQHILGQHSKLCAYSDLSSFAVLTRLMLGGDTGHRHLCIKPMDIIYLKQQVRIYRHFDKYLWLARDPRDSYLSCMESGYAYLFWPRGLKEAGIDTGLLKRWKKIYRHFFDAPERWHLLRYEDLVLQPDETLAGLFDYLELPYERLLPFSQFKMRNGGDYKIRSSSTVKSLSVSRYIRQLSALQIGVFENYLGNEIQRLGYS
ncbi:MAG: sulfotransferase [Desulfobacterales bacterium]|nr:sulfotransferase [Desulfobacterales bacterium]MBS3809627.1 sulfotransferase [Desulfobacterales bacterium]